MAGMTVVDRYAPSPTWQLHLGNLRTALAGWLLTRAAGGRWLMRIEDLDQSRVAAAPGCANQQLDELHRLGLDWDGGVMWQSQRAAAYDSALAQLADRTYECFCTRREIRQAASAPHDDGYRPYPGTCARLSSEQAARLREHRPAALRIRAEQAEFSIQDEQAGKVTGVIDDFVLARNDGQIAYNLAVVVDDIAQGVTRISRGADLLSSAPRQAWLTTLLGSPAPTYAHIGLVSDTEGTRLAKRHASATMADLASRGFDTAAVMAMLSASLGLDAHDTAQAALAEFSSQGPSAAFWRPARWDETTLRLLPA